MKKRNKEIKCHLEGGPQRKNEQLIIRNPAATAMGKMVLQQIQSVAAAAAADNVS